MDYILQITFQNITKGHLHNLILPEMSHHAPP